MKYLFGLLLLLVILPNVQAYTFIDEETKDNFTVKWYLERDGISKVSYIVEVYNLENEKRGMSLSSIFEPENYPTQEITDINFYEHEEKLDLNTSIPYYVWTESKPIFTESKIKDKKVDYDTINIGKLERKTFRLRFRVPVDININAYGSRTKFFLGINNNTYHPWLNVSWFSRIYVYDIESVNSPTQRTIIFDTRSLFLQESIKEDCTDIRVTDSDGIELEYRLGGGCLTRKTVIDIEMPTNLTVLYIYHNNPNAGNVSNASILVTDNTPGLIIDDSGNGNSGTSELGPVYGIGFNNGSAILFDNTDSRINITDRSDIDIGIDNFTYIAVVNTSLSDWDYIYTKRTGGGNEGMVLLIRNTGVITCTVGNSTGTEVAMTTTDTVNDGQLHQIACTGDRGGNLTIYIDSVISKTVDMSILEGDNLDTSAHGFLGVGEDGSTFPFGGIIDEFRVYNKTQNQSFLQNIWNGSSPVDSSELKLYYSFNTTNTTPSFSFELQQYSPFFASERTWEGVWSFPNSTSRWPAPEDSSIYDIKVSLGFPGACTKNEFDLDTDTFQFYGNVTKFSVSKTWDACLVDKVNISTFCAKYIDKVDFGKSVIKYGIGWSFGLQSSEDIFTEHFAGGNSFISRPSKFDGITSLLGGDYHYLSYPKEFSFQSSCIDNDITVKYQRDISLEESGDRLASTGGGIIDTIKGLGGGAVEGVGTSLRVITYMFSLLIFVLKNPWLLLILFEMFALIYSIKTTYTMSEFIGAYAQAHYKGIDLIIKVLTLMFNFVQRIVSWITNLIPFT